MFSIHGRSLRNATRALAGQGSDPFRRGLAQRLRSWFGFRSMQPPDQKWPDVLWLVRHGESAGNVARQQAYLSQQPLIDLAMRDPDVPLSETGEAQAAAL